MTDINSGAVTGAALNAAYAAQITEIYRQLGELTAEARNGRESRAEIKEALEIIRKRLHEIANAITPMANYTDRLKKVEQVVEVINDTLIRQGGLRKGIGIGLMLGSGTLGAMAIKLLEYIIPHTTLGPQ